VCVCVRACVHACVRACVRAYMRAYMRACVHACVYHSTIINNTKLRKPKEMMSSLQWEMMGQKDQRRDLKINAVVFSVVNLKNQVFMVLIITWS